MLVMFTYLQTRMNALLKLAIYLFYMWHKSDVSLSGSWHWWAATASAACVARLLPVADWWRGWPSVLPHVFMKHSVDQVSNRDAVQVQRRDGGWVDAVPIPNTVLINIGDLLQRWTSDKLISTV